MKAIVAAVSLFACAVSLNAQISATLSHLPDGRDEVRIRNNSATGLAAFVVAAKRAPHSGAETNTPIFVYSDPLVDPLATVLPAGEERLVMSDIFEDSFGKRHRILETPIVTAGIFGDGTTIGDAVLLTQLMSRRRNLLVAVEMSRETLADAGRRNVPRNQLIAQFKKLEDSVSRWYLPPEQQIGRSLYQSMIAKLMDLPEAQLGSAFPPGSFVEREMATLSRQRATLLKSQPNLAAAALIGQ